MQAKHLELVGIEELFYADVRMRQIKRRVLRGTEQVDTDIECSDLDGGDIEL